MSRATDRISLPMILLLGSLMAYGAISIDLYLPALPAIGRDFGIDAGRVQQSLTAFFIGMMIGQLVIGPLSDRVGRRPVLLGSALVYVAASLLCGLAPSIDWLIGARFVQALGACAGMVLARAVVRDLYGEQDMARIFSMLILVFGVAPLFAPTLGGWLVTIMGWRALFIVLTAFGLILGLAVLFGLPESRSAETAELARGEHVGTSYLALLRHRRFAGYMLASAFNGACMFSYIAGAPDLVIVQLGFSPQMFGVIFAVMAFGVIATSQLNRLLLNHVRLERILRFAGPGSVVAGVLLLIVAVTGAGGALLLLAALFLVLASSGLVNGNAQAAALGIDRARAGTASAVLGSAQFAAGALTVLIGGLLHDGTAVPMAAAMAVALLLSTLALYLLALPPARRAAPGAAA